MRKKVTYEQIRKIDPFRFFDLEVTMKMLYDHGPNGQIEPGVPDTDTNPNQSYSSTPVLKESSFKKKQQYTTTPQIQRKS